MRSELAVGVAAMLDTVNRDELMSVINHQQNSVVTDAKTIAFGTGELFDIGTPGLASEQADTLKDQLTMGFWNRAEVFFNPPIIHDLVHGLDELLPFEAGEELVVRNGAATGPDGLLEGFRVGQIFNEMDQLSVIDQRENDRGWPSPLIDEKSLWLQECSHGSCESSMRCYECQRGGC